MKLPFTKSKEEKEIEREVAYREVKVTLNRYIDKCEELRKEYWNSGREAAKLGDQKLLRQFSLGVVSMEDRANRARKLLLYIKGIKLKGEDVKLSGEFVKFAKNISASILEGVDAKSISKMQVELEKAMSRAEQIDIALSTVMDVVSEGILSSPEMSEKNIAEVEQLIQKEAATAESEIDLKIDEKLKRVEEAIRREK
jgi:hypothetical protein